MKQLIIHMDDMGMSYASNKAGMDLFENGIATSASIMAPCPWAKEFAEYSRENPKYDVGIHFTLSSEWKNQRWRLFTPVEQQPGFYDQDGFARMNYGEDDRCDVDCAAMEREMQLQYNQLIKWGAHLSHTDSHMFVNLLDDDTFKMSLEFADRHNLRISVGENCLWNDTRKAIVAENLKNPMCQNFPFRVGKDLKQSRKLFLKTLAEMGDGIHICTIHPIVETEEIKQIIPCWEERYLEYKFMLDRTLLEEIQARDVKLISWRDVPFDEE